MDARRDAAPARKALDVAEAIVRADAARPVQSSEAPAATEAAGTVVALALDPVLASYKAQLERETARDFAGPPFGAGANAVGSGAGDADAVVATAAWCCGAADDACRDCARCLWRRPRRRRTPDALPPLRSVRRDVRAREAASRLLRRCGLEPMLLRCRKVELLQARGEVLGPAAEAISRETLAAALRAFYSALFQDPAPDLDAIAPERRRAEARSLCAKIARARARVRLRARGRRSHGRLRRDGLFGALAGPGAGVADHESNWVPTKMRGAVVAVWRMTSSELPDGGAGGRCFAGAERGSRSKSNSMHRGRMNATEHAPRGRFHLLERRHGRRRIVERGAGVLVVGATATHGRL